LGFSHFYGLQRSERKRKKNREGEKWNRLKCGWLAKRVTEKTTAGQERGRQQKDQRSPEERRAGIFAVWKSLFFLAV
jgi:hypothetical protein